MLLLLNGAPGVGKSALAGVYAEGNPLALVIEVDDLRRSLGRWESADESKLVARELAVALARDHLARGYDVVIPQYLGHREFAERLRVVATEAKTPFLEVVLYADDDAILERFRQRRVDLAETGVRHPEADLHDDAVEPEIRSANERLRAHAVDCALPLIDTGPGIESAYEALLIVRNSRR